jgi:hypothetical protein
MFTTTPRASLQGGGGQCLRHLSRTFAGASPSQSSIRSISTTTTTTTTTHNLSRRPLQQQPPQSHLPHHHLRTYATSLTSSIRISNLPAPHAGEITILSLNRPKARNAISTQLLGELREVVERLHADGVKSGIRAIVLASESDEAFCAGADLKERMTFSDEE